VRQHAERAICQSVTRVHQPRMVEVGIVQFSPYSSPHPSSFCGISFIQKFWLVPLSGSIKHERVEHTSCFLDLSVSISKTVQDASKVTTILMTNRELITPLGYNRVLTRSLCHFPLRSIRFCWAWRCQISTTLGYNEPWLIKSWQFFYDLLDWIQTETASYDDLGYLKTRRYYRLTWPVQNVNRKWQRWLEIKWIRQDFFVNVSKKYLVSRYFFIMYLYPGM